MGDWVQYIPSIITALGTIVLGWFTYNQYRKNKMTDLEIDKIRNQDKIENKRRSDNSSLVFGELWDVLHEVDADRVYIVQPHPLGHEELLTIYFEVKKRGIEPMKPHIQKLKICDVPKFSTMLVKNLFLYIKDVDEEVEDRYAKSIISSCGCKNVIIKRLSDNRHDWVGSIFCEFNSEMTISEESAKAILHNAATNIQYILPEITE